MLKFSSLRYFLPLFCGLLILSSPLDAKKKKGPKTVVKRYVNGKTYIPFQPNPQQRQAAVEFSAIPGLIKNQVLQNTYSERLYIIRNGNEFYRLLVISNPQRLTIKRDNYNFSSPLIVANDPFFPEQWHDRISDLGRELNINMFYFGETVFGNKPAMELFGYK